MRAATEFERINRLGMTFSIAPHRHDAHFVAILLAKQRHGTFGNSVIHTHQPRVHGIILQHNVIGHGFNKSDLVI